MQPGAGTVHMRVGVQGRVIVGPAGAPAQAEVPLRYAVVREGVEPKTIVTKFRRFPVPIPPGNTNVEFTDIEEDLSFPLPSVNELQAYVVYIGFDDVGRPHQRPAPRRKSPRRDRGEFALVELAEVFDALGDELVGDRALDVLGKHLLRGRDSGVGGGGTHVGNRLRFGLGNLGLRHLGPARDEFFGLGCGFDAPSVRPPPWPRR